jgi:ATP-binding cassette subfamily C (CFTR/MRP) protein 10
MQAVQIWLSMRLEFLGALIVLARGRLRRCGDARDPGLAGLALAYSLNVIVQMNEQVESKMNSVERILEYSTLENEKACGGAVDPPEGWPVRGHVVFENVALQYRKDLEPAILGVSLDIPAGAKVGIVGKTGGGKSTLNAALLRLVPISQGRVLIDGVDIATLKVLIRWLGAGAFLASAVFLFASVYAGSSRPADVAREVRNAVVLGRRSFAEPSFGVRALKTTQREVDEMV